MVIKYSRRPSKKERIAALKDTIEDTKTEIYEDAEELDALEEAGDTIGHSELEDEIEENEHRLKILRRELKYLQKSGQRKKMRRL